MAVNCNKIAALDEAQMEAKASFAKATTIALLGAVSDCYRAAEMLQAKLEAKPEIVYLRSANAKLQTATTALLRTREILEGAPPREGAIEWLQNLDFDRLYQEGVGRGTIPANVGLWSRLVELTRSQGYLGVIDALGEDISGLQSAIKSLVEVLEAPDRAEVRDAAAVNLHTALANLTVFAQMVAYVNAVPTRDPTWLKTAPSTLAFSST